jgi:hypothetical protein
MRVNTQHIHEKSPGVNYEYDLYEFDVPGLKYVVRSYTSEADEAHFLRKEVDGRVLELTAADAERESFRAAVAYLRARGKSRVNYLSSEAGAYIALRS